jgi:hypothetical protein
MTRHEEFELLQDLVRTAGSLDRGSNVSEKIKLLEKLADAVTRDDMAKPRKSLMKHLEDLLSCKH